MGESIEYRRNSPGNEAPYMYVQERFCVIRFVNDPGYLLEDSQYCMWKAVGARTANNVLEEYVIAVLFRS